MKTKGLGRVVLAVVCGAFVAVNFVFSFDGRLVRDWLSPAVSWTYPAYAATENGRMVLTLPKSAILSTDGTTFVYAIRLSEAYPEVCYEVYRREIRVLGEDEETVYLIPNGVTDAERIVDTPSAEWIDGTRILMVE